MRTIENLAILFVDDEPDVLSSLRRFLRKEPYQTFFAEGGKNALSVMKSNAIHIVVSDLRMPEMNGMELIHKVKTLYPDVIRVILSATRDVEQTIESINSGEVYRFIPKPLDPESFKQIMLDAIDYYRIKTERQELLNELSDSNTYLENALAAVQKINTEKEKMEEEAREVERRIGEHLLQPDLPKQIKGATIAATSISSDHLDGDFFDFIDYGNERFDMIIADVMGKGIQSALVGAGVKAMILKALAQQGRSEEFWLEDHHHQNALRSVESIISTVHDMSIEKLLKLKMFVTFCYGRFDLTNSQMAFIDCGHTKTLHYRPSTGESAFLEGENLPLGMLEQAEYTSKVVQLEKNDIFLFYSDGVTEAENIDGDCFGPNRLADIVTKNSQLSPEKLLKYTQGRVTEFTGKPTFDDDFSCIIVRID